MDGEDPPAPRSPVLVVLAQAPSAARGLVGGCERAVPCHFCLYYPWSCTPSARSGTQARLEWHLRGTLVERCAQSRDFPRAGRTPMGPPPVFMTVCPVAARRKVGEVRPSRGFVALSQVLRGAATTLWSRTPAHGGFLLPPPPRASPGHSVSARARDLRLRAHVACAGGAEIRCLAKGLFCACSSLSLLRAACLCHSV